MNHIIVVDVEATCWENNPPVANEIIEIGAVAYHREQGIQEEFQTFVKPMLKPALSEFCKSLTNIRQEQVSLAPSFSEAFQEFCQWGREFWPYVWASWGNYDRRQFQQDCQLHGIEYVLPSHINLKEVFTKITQNRRCGMARALEKVGLPLEGVHHRGIDDARNITRLLEYLLERGFDPDEERWHRK